MRLMYAGELAYYLATIIMLALWEVPRKDSHVMMTHHVVTVVLLTFSYKYKWVALFPHIMLGVGIICIVTLTVLAIAWHCEHSSRKHNLPTFRHDMP